MLKISSKSWKCVLLKKQNFLVRGGVGSPKLPPLLNFWKFAENHVKKLKMRTFEKKNFFGQGGVGGCFLSQIKWKNLVYLVKIWIWHQFWHWHWEAALVKFECQKFWHSKTAFAMAFAASATILHNWNGTQKWHLQCQIQCQCQCHFFT